MNIDSTLLLLLLLLLLLSSAASWEKERKQDKQYCMTLEWAEFILLRRWMQSTLEKILLFFVSNQRTFWKCKYFIPIWYYVKWGEKKAKAVPTKSDENFLAKNISKEERKNETNNEALRKLFDKFFSIESNEYIEDQNDGQVAEFPCWDISEVYTQVWICINKILLFFYLSLSLFSAEQTFFPFKHFFLFLFHPIDAQIEGCSIKRVVCGCSQRERVIRGNGVYFEYHSNYLRLKA